MNILKRKEKRGQDKINSVVSKLENILIEARKTKLLEMKKKYFDIKYSRFRIFLYFVYFL
jgi:hypothetical protein